MASPSHRQESLPVPGTLGAPPPTHDQDGNLNINLNAPLESPYAKPAEPPLTKDEELRQDILRYSVVVQMIAVGLFVYGLKEIGQKGKEDGQNGESAGAVQKKSDGGDQLGSPSTLVADVDGTPDAAA